MAHIKGYEDVHDRKWRDDDGKQRRRSHDADCVVLGFLHANVRRKSERSRDKAQVDRPNEQGRERVLQDELGEPRALRLPLRLLLSQLEWIEQVVLSSLASEGCPGCRPAGGLRDQAVVGQFSPQKQTRSGLLAHRRLIHRKDLGCRR